jgi:hypothetical protein
MKRQITDQKRLRGEYLLTKAEAYASGVLCIVLFLATGAIALLCLYVAVRTFLPFLHGDTLGSVFVGAIVSETAAGFSAWHLAKGIEGAKVRATTTYVPPVTPDTLPLDEILVRGSEEPTIQSEVLLRAAKSEVTLKEELLRGSLERTK